MGPEYAEFDDHYLEPPPDDGTTLTNPGLSDDAETQFRRQAWRQHVQRSKSQESTVYRPEFKRSTSKTDLLRQLSKQKSIQEEEAASPTGGATLILEEKAETGTVRG